MICVNTVQFNSHSRNFCSANPFSNLGPPGCGKSTMAALISEREDRVFYEGKLFLKGKIVFRANCFIKNSLLEVWKLSFLKVTVSSWDLTPTSHLEKTRQLLVVMEIFCCWKCHINRGHLIEQHKMWTCVGDEDDESYPVKVDESYLVKVKVSWWKCMKVTWWKWMKVVRWKWMKVISDANQVECRNERAALIGPGMKERQKGMRDYFRFCQKCISPPKK